MFCTKCGTKFEGNFCPNCGTPVAKIEKSSHIESPKIDASNHTHTVSPVEISEPVKKKHTGLGCLMFVVVLIVLLIAIVQCSISSVTPNKTGWPVVDTNKLYTMSLDEAKTVYPGIKEETYDNGQFYVNKYGHKTKVYSNDTGSVQLYFSLDGTKLYAAFLDVTPAIIINDTLDVHEFLGYGYTPEYEQAGALAHYLHPDSEGHIAEVLLMADDAEKSTSFPMAVSSVQVYFN